MSRALWIRSELLDANGFVHVFTTRRGGVSTGHFASMNLARAIGDEPGRVSENTARLCAALGVSEIHEVSQVHGARVLAVDGASSVRVSRKEEADGLLALSPGLAVGVRTADCVPVLLADPESGAVAAVHAGWRGVEARVVGVAVERLLGSDGAGGLLAAIGPHIRVASFEVSEPIARRISSVAHGVEVVQAHDPRPHVDLARAVSAQLRALGVSRIDDVGGCTYAEPERFFSHRRDAGATGRHLSVIVARRGTSSRA